MALNPYYRETHWQQICIITGSTNWIKQIEEILDIGIGKIGLWIVRTDNRVYYRDHSHSSLVSGINSTGWQLVNGKKLFNFG